MYIYIQNLVNNRDKPLGGSSHVGYVVNNHGDRKSPKDRVVPLISGHSWLIKGGDPNYLPTGMILQAEGRNTVDGSEIRLTS